MNQKDFSIKIAAADTRKTRERAYWLRKLSADGDPVKSHFPYDFDYKRDNSDISSIEFKKVNFKLSERQFSLVMKLAGDSNVKLYILLVSILNLLLDKYMYTRNYPGDSHRDIIIGTPISRQEDEKNLINTVLPIRNRFNDEMPVKELLMQVRKAIIEAAEHQNYPVESLPDQLDLANSGPGFPLFDIILLLENIHDKRYIEHIAVNVIISFCRNSEAVEGLVEYNPRVYRQETMEQVVNRFKRLVENGLDGLAKPLRGVEMVSEEEKSRVLVEFNQTAAPYPADKTLQQLFVEQKDKTPDHIAVIGRVHVTYKELNEKSNQLAHYLIYEKGVQGDERVGILMESSLDLAVAILGILKAGAAYLPIDSSLPGERMKTIIHDASVGVVLSQKKYLRILNRLQWECESFHTYLCMNTRDIDGEEEEEKSGLMDRTLWEYVGESAANDIEGGGWLSSYTGESFTSEEMAEYGDNVLKKLGPLLHPEMRVLEIGCASGITMYRIAPRVGFYYGTDLSRVIIEKNKKRVEQEGHENIRLSCAAAHETGQLGENNFDLVIMNSVIQCFHGHHYLVKVIRRCIDLMGEEGYLFIGDIMDQELKEALICEMIKFKRTHKGRGNNYKTKIDFSEELFISRAFFADLAVDMAVIRELEFSSKLYTIENELTKFRYDVLINIDKKQRRSNTTSGSRKECRHKYQQDARSIESYDSGDVHCRVRPENLAYVIYTSGSTGKPKGVIVEHRSVVNTLFYRKEAYRMDASVRALQLFSYAFDGFVTAFFTPLLSGAAVILPWGEEGKDILKIKEAIFTIGVGHFISVPALFRVLMESLTPEQASLLKVVALAGDKLTPDLLELAGKKNKELEIVNEYGVTEAAVMSTLYRHQERDNNIKIGFPIGNTRIYILDSGNRPQPVGIYGELCIAGVGVARGYLNNPELTAEKFVFYRSYRSYKTYISKKLYKTGDLARWLVDGAIEFAGRIDAQVKIRGFRIETGEIESLLMGHEEVSEALVTVVETGAGESSLCAYVVPYAGYSADTADLKEYLFRQLPDYMIPVYFVFIEKVPLSASGKVDRRALPKPGAIRRQKGTVPRDEVEEKLAEIWCQVLGIDESQGVVGIDDNFFELGGHSLRATALIARIHKEMNVEVPLSEIFKSPYIRDLAQYIREASQTRYSPIKPVEKKEFYLLSPAQQRFYMMQRMTPGTTAYNMPQVIPLGPDVDNDRIETAFKRLIERHESLRTAFITVDNKPVQRVYDEVEFEIEFFDLAAKNAKGREEEENIMRYFVRPFDLSQSPLLRVNLVETPGGEYLLLVDIHHIISDGTSQMVLASDFVSLYKGEALESIRLQYRDFSQWQNRMLGAESGRMKADRVFWLDHLAGKLPVLNIPTDFPRPRERSYAGESFSGSLGRELSRQVSRLSRQTNTTLYMVLLTALNILLFRYSGQKDIIIGSPSAGRNHADLEKLIGLVLGTIMMRNFPSAEKSFREFLQEVKTRTLAAYEHHAYPFEELLKKLDYREDPSRNPVSDVALIVQNMFPAAPGKSAAGVPGVSMDSLMPGVSKLDFTINALEQGGEIVFLVEYSTALFCRGTMERLMAHLGNILREAIKNPEISLVEIDLLTTAEKRGVIGTDVVCFPLSHPQERIYYTEKRYPHTGVCNLAFTARYNRLLDRGLLEEAINRALQVNEGLRLRIVEFDYFNDPFQYIAPSRRFTLEEAEVGLSGGLAEWLEQEARKPFDPVNNDFFYFAYLKFSENESGYYMKFHHIAADGWTILSLFKEIDEIYETLETGNPVEVDTTPSYLQFISDENNYLNSTEAGKDRDFWHRYLLPLPEKIELSPGNRNNAGAAVEADVCILAFPGDLRTQIHQYCRAHRTSIFKVLLSALSVYIWRVTGKNDFVIGSANHNRTNEDYRRMAGMFVSTIPFRIRINESMTFAGLLEKTGRETDNILKNYQRYPFDLLMDELREKTGEDVGYLLDVNLVGHPDVKEDKYRIEHHFPGYEPTPLSIHINGNNRDIRGILEMEWDFQLQQFSLEDIQRIHRGLVHILTDALVNPSKELWQIQWLSAEEKERVVDLFNRSGTVEAETFYADKPLHRLFEEQAEKRGDGVALVGNVSITYAELNRKSGQLAVVLRERGVLADDIVAIMVERSVEMFTGILGILKTGAAYLPIDPDYPQERIDYMLKDSGAKILLTELPEGHKLHHSSFIIHHSSNLAYIIYTSGSTGNPKGVMVTHGNVVNYLNAFDWQFDLQPTDIVVQQASYVFDAFVEEMYPILLKGGVLAIPLKEEVTDIQRLVDFIVRHQVTMITCSPLMLSQLNRHPAIYGTPIRIFISGGDRLKNEHIDNLLKIETAKVYNTYGPTETTVCAAYYRVADIHEAAVPIGKPIPGYRIYILDAYLQPVPVGVNGELCIAGIGVSQGYLNQPELTAEKFKRAVISHSSLVISSSKGTNDQCPMTNDRLYHTGDLARWLADGNIEFIGRIDSQVNIRGYRIEPGEIENRLNKLETIHDALVVAREDKSGDFYLCAYIIPGDRHVNVSGLREYLLRQLPAYMVPAFFVTVESIPLTPNGKPDLKALPDPWSGPVDDYAPPVDRTEEELVTLWSEVLNIPGEHIGVTANFFELGGHSLKATLLVSYIHKKLNVELSLADVFKTPTIRELSGSIKALTKNAYSLIEPAAKKEYYSLSSAQKRLYFLQQMDLASIAYNMPLVLPLGKGIEKVKLETALKKLIRRHESLRTSFEVVNGEPVQRIHDEVEFEIEFLAAKAVARHPKTKVREGIVRNFIRPFDLSKVPLMRSGLIKTHDGNHTWMVDIHHIVSDGTSHTVLAEDFTALYNEEELEPLRLQYKDFSEWQNRLIESGKIKKQEDYWLKLYSGEIPRLHMPTDYKRPEVFTFAGAHYYFMLPGEDAVKFKALASRKGGTLYMNIMAALNTLFYKYTGQSDIIIGSGIAGRSHADLQRIIGMFVNTLAMRNFPRGEKTYEFLLTEVIAHSVEAFENQDVQFEELVERLDPERDPSRNPLFDISMVVQNFRRLNEVISIRKEPDQGDVLPLITTKFDMTFFTVESNGNVYFDVEYYTGVFKEETVRRLVSHFINIIKTVVNNPSIKLKDVDIISGEERKQVLYEFNDTAEDYPGDKAIHQLLEEIVEKSGDGVAVVCGGQGAGGRASQLTYGELNRKSNQLANYLYDEKHIRPEEPVGISMTQPVALAVAVLGILKAGAAYVPLDPSLPEDRLKYMIDDARIGIVISEKRYIKTLNRLQWECDSFHSYICMDSYDIHGEAEVETSELMDEELWNHVGETAADDITAGGWVSSYTGEPFSRLEMDEYGDNILKKLEPLLDPGMRVLEIGCASGITMYRIAPKAGLYYGTDLSPVMIEWNRKRVEKEGYRNIKLSCLAAHEIHRIEERNFDLIIMNSVIQCFHGHHYLRKVILQCIELLGERGYLFLGDIMDREKKDALVRELTAFKYAAKKDFSAELFVSREYWEDLGAESDVIADIRFSDKFFSIENELTRFRYDVLITVNKKTPGVGKNKWKKQKYQEDATRILEYRMQALPAQAGANNLAYIIYTSGTTGVPKGVEVEHRSVVNTLCCRKAEYGLNSQDVALQLFSYGFDGFVTGFFTPLVSGARLIVLSGEEQGNVDKIKAAIVKNSVTHFISVPPLYNALLESMTGEELSTLKAVTLAGDRVSVELLERTKEKSGCIEIVNEYGVTEAAVMSTLYRNQDRDNTIKIGHPIWNTQLYVLNEGERLQPVGVPGELCIGGVGLARGYLNNPELTAGKFFVYRSYRSYRTYISKKIYKTGDLARWLADGNIEFLGRIDHQVKIRGFRIELGEIESRLLKHESIKEAVVIDRENEQGDKYLCAYISPEGVSDLNNAALKEYLARTLPAYMIPRYFVRLDKIPITSNGKLDRKKLPKPGFTPGEAYVAPATEIEEKLAVVWSEVLGIEKEVVGVESGFFELGGHSLSLIKMKARIKEVFNIDIPVAGLFQLTTIRALAVHIQGEETNLQVAEEILDESVDSMDETLRLFEEFEDE